MDKRTGAGDLLHRNMEELRKLTLLRTEFTISVKRDRGEILLPTKLSKAMNLTKGDMIMPLQNRFGDIGIKKLEAASTDGLKCYKKPGKKEKRLVVYCTDWVKIMLKSDEDDGRYIVDKQTYNGEEVYFICTKNNYHDRATKYKAKRNNKASGRQDE